MIVEKSAGLSPIARKCRIALWIALLLLTTALLIFPVKLNYEYHAIESMYILGDKLVFFGVLYSSWMAILLALLFLFKGKNDVWEKLALIILFSLVFVSFWIFITPFGRYADEVNNLVHVKYLMETGTITLLNPNVGYFSFPGIHITGASLVEVSGLGIFEMRTVFVVFLSLLFSTLLYVFCLKSIKNTRLAALAVLIMIIGNIVLARQPVFWPGSLAFIFFFVLLILLYRQVETPFGIPLANSVLMLITFTALVVSYLITPVYFIFILFGIFILQSIGKKNLVGITIITLFCVIFVAWELYWAVGMFEGVVGWGKAFIEELTSNGLGSHFLFLREASTQLGERVPLWVSSIRLFWLFVTYVIGGFIALFNLTRIKKLSLIEIIETGALMLVILLSIVIQFLARGGSQYHRLLMYSHFFTVPIALRFFAGLADQNKEFPKMLNIRPFLSRFKSPRWQHHATVIGIVILLVLAFPTFLAHHDQVSTYNVFAYEYTGGKFLSNTYGTGKGLVVFTDTLTISPTENSLYEANYQGSASFENITNEDVFWQIEYGLANLFLQKGNSKQVFVLAEKITFPGWRLFGIEPDDPKWVELENRLNTVNKIYNNGHSQIFSY